jgi:hypothetical protein
VTAVLPALPDFKALAASQGCEHALDEAIQAIAALSALVQAEEESLTAAQATIASQQTTIESLTADVAELAGSVTTLTDVIAGQQGGDRRPVGVTLSVVPRKDPQMATTITVDTTNEIISLAFTDDHGDATTAPNSPDGTAGVLTATSDTPTVATVGAFTLNATGGATGGPIYTAPITPVAEGSFNAGATITDDTGAPIPLPAPVAGGPQTFNDEATPVLVTVTAGAAAGLVLGVS